MPDTMPKRFFEDVFQVAFEALDLRYFHWNIRPANIMFDDEKKCFVIIDWESVVFISYEEVSKNLISKFKENAKYLDNLQLLNDKDPKLAAGVYVFYHLLDCLEYPGGRDDMCITLFMAHSAAHCLSSTASSASSSLAGSCAGDATVPK